MPDIGLVLPVVLKKRTILLAYSDDGQGDSVTLDRQGLSVLKEKTEAALMRVILMRKSRRRR
jgi:hypothetical protein